MSSSHRSSLYCFQFLPCLHVVSRTTSSPLCRWCKELLGEQEEENDNNSMSNAACARSKVSWGIKSTFGSVQSPVTLGYNPLTRSIPLDGQFYSDKTVDLINGLHCTSKCYNSLPHSPRLRPDAVDVAFPLEGDKVAVVGGEGVGAGRAARAVPHRVAGVKQRQRDVEAGPVRVHGDARLGLRCGWIDSAL